MCVKADDKGAVVLRLRAYGCFEMGGKEVEELLRERVMLVRREDVEGAKERWRQWAEQVLQKHGRRLYDVVCKARKAREAREVQKTEPAADSSQYVTI